MIIGVCGYGYSGSGALLDFLREWSTCSYPSILQDLEFDILYLPHGIQDLEYQLLERKTRYLASNAALKDFKKLIYGMDSPRSYYRRLTGSQFRERSITLINELTQVSWRGYGYIDRYNESFFYRMAMGRKRCFVRYYERWTNRKWPYSKRSMMYLSVAPDNFSDCIKRYLRDLIEMLGYDLKKKVLLNQPFDVYEPSRSMKYFDTSRAILVDRDPRDIYVLAKKYLKSKGSFIPTDKVEDFIKYHKLVRNTNMKDDTNILCIRYEDMVYAYEETSRKLMEFLDLVPAEWERGKYFKPDISIENTQLFLKHPELKEDVSLIEQQLPQYLYPFECYDRKPVHAKRPF